MTSYLVIKIWPFYGPGYWGGYLGAFLCNALSSNKLCPKTVKILAVKGLRAFCITEQHYVSIIHHSFMYAFLCFFKYIGRLVTIQHKKSHFIPSSVHISLRLVLYLYACAVRILKFQDYVYRKSENFGKTLDDRRLLKRIVFLMMQTTSGINTFIS